MTDYRLYVLDAAGKISSPPRMCSVAAESEALAAALLLCKTGRSVEMWQGARLVCRLPAASVSLSSAEVFELARDANRPKLLF